jgi:hypothetical protein
VPPTFRVYSPCKVGCECVNSKNWEKYSSYPRMQTQFASQDTNHIKSNIFVSFTLPSPLFDKICILRYKLFFLKFCAPWVRYLSSEGVFLKFLKANENFQGARKEKVLQKHVKTITENPKKRQLIN